MAGPAPMDQLYNAMKGSGSARDERNLCERARFGTSMNEPRRRSTGARHRPRGLQSKRLRQDAVHVEFELTPAGTTKTQIRKRHIRIYSRTSQLRSRTDRRFARVTRALMTPIGPTRMTRRGIPSASASSYRAEPKGLTLGGSRLIDRPTCVAALRGGEGRNRDYVPADSVDHGESAMFRRRWIASSGKAISGRELTLRWFECAI
jgi:hypothetical protein